MFRKAALTKLASPEQLDSLMQVTTPKGWIALLASIVLILAGLLWGIFGRTAERVSGAGILLKEGGIFGIESRGNGIVSEVLVNVGSLVRPGEVVARISQTGVPQEIDQTESLLTELRANRQRSLSLIQRNREAELRTLAEDRTRFAASRAALENQIKFLEQRLRAQTEAAESGLITRDQVQGTAQELEAARSSLISNQGQMMQIAAREATIHNQAEQQVFTLDQEIRRNERQLELTRLRFATYGSATAAPSTIRSAMNCEVERVPPNTLPRTASPR